MVLECNMCRVGRSTKRHIFSPTFITEVRAGITLRNVAHQTDYGTNAAARWASKVPPGYAFTSAWSPLTCREASEPTAPA